MLESTFLIKFFSLMSVNSGTFYAAGHAKNQGSLVGREPSIVLYKLDLRAR